MKCGSRSRGQGEPLMEDGKIVVILKRPSLAVILIYQTGTIFTVQDCLDIVAQASLCGYPFQERR